MSAMRVAALDTSLPSRGAWIEIVYWTGVVLGFGGRSPHGERGLKYEGQHGDHRLHQSLPSRGAWIEIPPRGRRLLLLPVAPLTGSVD